MRGWVSSSSSSSLVSGWEGTMVVVGESLGVDGDLVAREGELMVDPLRVILVEEGGEWTGRWSFFLNKEGGS